MTLVENGCTWPKKVAKFSCIVHHLPTTSIFFCEFANFILYHLFIFVEMKILIKLYSNKYCGEKFYIIIGSL